MRNLLFSLAVLLGLAGAGAAQAHDVGVSVVFGDARHPPALRAEHIPPAPHVVGATWVPGHWDYHLWRGYWEWIPGYWAYPEYPQYYDGPRVGVGWYYEPWPPERRVVVVRPPPPRPAYPHHHHH